MFERLLIATGLIAAAVTGFSVIKKLQLSKIKNNGNDEKIKPGIPAILYFWSSSCHVCKTIQRPMIELLLKEFFTDRIQFIDVNIEDEQSYADKWGVMTVPSSFIIDERGECKFANSGLVRKEILQSQIGQVVKT